MSLRHGGRLLTDDLGVTELESADDLVEALCIMKAISS